MTGYVPVIGDHVTATHLKAATPTAVGKVDHVAFDGSTVVVLDESNVRWWLPVKDYRIERLFDGAW